MANELTDIEVEESILDTKFYTCQDTGHQISLRNASPLSVNITGMNDNRISVYDKTTNQHYKISEAYESEGDALSKIDDYNRQMHSEVIQNNFGTASHQEHKQWEDRKAEIAKEQSDPNFGKSSNSPYLD